jgi:hypothetical protein
LPNSRPPLVAATAARGEHGRLALAAGRRCSTSISIVLQFAVVLTAIWMAMFPSVNGYFFIPIYGSLIAAIIRVRRIPDPASTSR